MHIIHISTLVFRFLSLLTFTSIFIYWSITAIIKYKSGKTVSSVSYRFGDDGHGNINFPAITICLGAQSFTSLKIDLHQDINRIIAFSRYLNGTLFEKSAPLRLWKKPGIKKIWIFFTFLIWIIAEIY